MKKFCWVILISTFVNGCQSKPEPTPPKPVVEDYDDSQLRTELKELKADLFQSKLEIKSLKTEIAKNDLRAEVTGNGEKIAEALKILNQPIPQDEEVLKLLRQLLENNKNLSKRLEKMEQFATRAEARIKTMEDAFVFSDHAIITNVQKAQAAKRQRYAPNPFRRNADD